MGAHRYPPFHTWGPRRGGVCAGTQKLGKVWRGLVIKTAPRYDVPPWFASGCHAPGDHGVWNAGTSLAPARPGQLGCLVSLSWRGAVDEAASVSALEPRCVPGLAAWHGSRRVILASVRDGPQPPARLAGQSAAAPPRPGSGYLCTSAHGRWSVDLKVPSYLQKWRLTPSCGGSRSCRDWLSFSAAGIVPSSHQDPRPPPPVA